MVHFKLTKETTETGDVFTYVYINDTYLTGSVQWLGNIHTNDQSMIMANLDKAISKYEEIKANHKDQRATELIKEDKI